MLSFRLKKQNSKNVVYANFNINLLGYEEHKPTNEFLDSLSSNMFLPYIFLPTRISINSKTVIDIFSNFISNEVNLGNLTATISDHLPQFLIAPDIFCIAPINKTNLFERNWSKFNHENLILEYFHTTWLVLKLDMQNVERYWKVERCRKMLERNRKLNLNN